MNLQPTAKTEKQKSAYQHKSGIPVNKKSESKSIIFSAPKLDIIAGFIQEKMPVHQQ